VCGWVVVVLHGAGQGCHRVGDIVPCRCAWRVVLEEVLAHGNADARSVRSSGSIAADRLGRGGVLSGARASLVQGIDHTREEGLDGEVTSPGAVGAVWPKFGVHDGLGYGHGGVECCWHVAAGWGREEESAGVAITCWGSRAAPGR
jgi:hypothetical protein